LFLLTMTWTPTGLFENWLTWSSNVCSKISF